MEEKSMWKKLKKNNKKGFTLVELIVVLVILAILAALLIPALTGYIDKAKEKQIIAETRQIVMASQTLLDEAYAKGNASTTITFADQGVDLTGNAIVIGVKQAVTGQDVNTTTVQGLSEVTGLTYGTNVSIDVSATDKGKIGIVVYTAHGKRCRYQLTTKEYEVQNVGTDGVTWE